MKNIVEQIYIDWLKLLAMGGPSERYAYAILLNHLYNKEFVPILDKDENRVQDIYSFRKRFAYEIGLDASTINESITSKPNMLELMVSLSFYCYENITFTDNSDGISVWFESMLQNLGIDGMTDVYYDAEYVDEVLDNFMQRKYEPNGKGGLFMINDPDFDMRNVEIWYQMNKYINEKIINY